MFGDAVGAIAGGAGLDSATARGIMTAAGLLADGGLREDGLGDLAPVLALVEALPKPIVDRLLIELLAAGLEG